MDVVLVILLFVVPMFLTVSWGLLLRTAYCKGLTDGRYDRYFIHSWGKSERYFYKKGHERGQKEKA